MYCTALLGAAALCACRAALPVPFEENGRWGYRLKAGSVVIEPAFAVALHFSEKGVAFAADAAGWSCINKRGAALLAPLPVDNGPDYFSEGLARFRAGEKVGFFDEACKIVIPAEYNFALPFKDSAAEVCFGCREYFDGEHKTASAGLWGLIDKRGRILVELEHTSPETARGSQKPQP